MLATGRFCVAKVSAFSIPGKILLLLADQVGHYSLYLRPTKSHDPHVHIFHHRTKYSNCPTGFTQVIHYIFSMVSEVRLSVPTTQTHVSESPNKMSRLILPNPERDALQDISVGEKI